MALRRISIRDWKADAAPCIRCREPGLIHREGERWARPLFDTRGTCSSGVLVVAEAPNLEDTIDPTKGRLTYDIETDETGNFARELLAHVGLTTGEVMFTNAVLCLPAHNGKRYEVTQAILRQCIPWLRRLIDDVHPVVVVTFGARALDALRLIEDHGILRLRNNTGQALAWYRRHLLPLYHPGRLGRASRGAELQMRDIEPLRAFVTPEDR